MPKYTYGNDTYTVSSGGAYPIGSSGSSGSSSSSSSSSSSGSSGSKSKSKK